MRNIRSTISLLKNTRQGTVKSARRRVVSTNKMRCTGKSNDRCHPGSLSASLSGTVTVTDSLLERRSNWLYFCLTTWISTIIIPLRSQRLFQCSSCFWLYWKTSLTDTERSYIEDLTMLSTKFSRSPRTHDPCLLFPAYPSFLIPSGRNLLVFVGWVNLRQVLE